MILLDFYGLYSEKKHEGLLTDFTGLLEIHDITGKVRSSGAEQYTILTIFCEALYGLSSVNLFSRAECG